MPGLPGGPSGGVHPWPLLGIDLGTSSVKVVVLDDRGSPLARAVARYPIHAEHTGWAESDPEDWWRAVATAVAAAVRSAPARPRAIGLSGQMHGVVLTDANGRALRRALLWADGRAIGELEAYRRLPAPRLAGLGNPLSPGMAGPLLRWVATHETDTYRRARWALQPKDWLRLRLTGLAHGDPSDASATLLYDVFADRWDTGLAEALDLDPVLLPPLIPSSAVAGELAPGAAGELGLAAGTPVATGAADTAAAALGSGLIRPGRFQLTIGTGGQIVTPRYRPDADPAGGTHLYRAATPTGWYGMAAILNAGLALEWVAGVLRADWDELYAAAEQTPAPDDPLFLPHLTGERTPYLDTTLRAAWTGLALGHERAELLRAALEGVAFALRDALDALPGAEAATHIRLAGGGSTHRAWRQMLADVLGRTLYAVDVTDASARGAALLAGLAVGGISLDDVEQRLAPDLRLAAEPRGGAAARYAERLAGFRAAVGSQQRA